MNTVTARDAAVSFLLFLLFSGAFPGCKNGVVSKGSGPSGDATRASSPGALDVWDTEKLPDSTLGDPRPPLYTPPVNASLVLAQLTNRNDGTALVVGFAGAAQVLDEHLQPLVQAVYVVDKAQKPSCVTSDCAVKAELNLRDGSFRAVVKGVSEGGSLLLWTEGGPPYATGADLENSSTVQVKVFYATFPSDATAVARFGKWLAVGTYSEGLYVYDPAEFVGWSLKSPLEQEASRPKSFRLTVGDGLTSNRVDRLYGEDTALWVIAKGRLVHVREIDGKFTVHAHTEGVLEGRYLTAIGGDANGLWLGTNYGSAIRIEKAAGNAEGSSPVRFVSNFTSGTRVEFIQPSPDGTVWMASITTLTHLYPDPSKSPSGYGFEHYDSRPITFSEDFVPDFKLKKFPPARIVGSGTPAIPGAVFGVRVGRDGSVWFASGTSSQTAPASLFHLFPPGTVAERMDAYEIHDPDYGTLLAAGALGSSDDPDQDSRTLDVFVAKTDSILRFSPPVPKTYDSGESSFLWNPRLTNPPVGITQIYRDSQSQSGLWIAASNGLFLLGSNEHPALLANRFGTLTSNVVQTLVAVNDEQLLVGTRRGASRVTVSLGGESGVELVFHSTGNRFPRENGYSPVDVVGIGPHPTLPDAYLIATPFVFGTVYGSGAISVETKDSLSTCGSVGPCGLPFENDFNFTSLYVSPYASQLWVGRGSFVELRRPGLRGGWETLTFDADNGYVRGPVHSMLEDGTGGIWIGSDEGLVHLAPPASAQYTDFSDVLGEGVSTVISDGGKGLWIGTASGLRHCVESSADSSGEAKLDCSAVDRRTGRINGLLLDGDKGLWVATPAGLVYAKLSGFQVTDVKIYDARDGLPSPEVNAVARGPNGTVWVGTSNGLVLFSR